MFFHIRDLRRISFVNTKTLTTLANVLVVSRLDYCNCLFASLTTRELNLLQTVQNTLCRVLIKCKSACYSNIASYLKALDLLPVEFRVTFKTLLLSYRTLTICY